MFWIEHASWQHTNALDLPRSYTTLDCPVNVPPYRIIRATTLFNMASDPNVYFTYYHRDQHSHPIMPAADLWKLSTYDIRGCTKGRPGRARPFRKSQSVTFGSLPGEVLDLIFQYAYRRACRPYFWSELSVENDAWVSNNHSDGGRPPFPDHHATLVTLPRNLDQLFVSKTFLKHALPGFSDSIPVRIRLRSLDPLFRSLTRAPLLRFVCMSILRHTKAYTAVVGSGFELRKQLAPNMLLLNKLCTVEVDCTYDLLWLQEKHGAQARIICGSNLRDSHEMVTINHAMRKHDERSFRDTPAGNCPVEEFKHSFKQYLSTHEVYQELKRCHAQIAQSKPLLAHNMCFEIGVRCNFRTRGVTRGHRMVSSCSITLCSSLTFQVFHIFGCKEDQAVYVKADALRH